MRIVTFASGSSGNCSLLSDGDVHILIDAGISMRRIVAGLARYKLTPHDLSGVLITHEHSDHISGLPMLYKKYGVKVYAPGSLADVLIGILPELTGSINYISFETGQYFSALKVIPFRTPHDVVCSVGYRFEGSSVFAIATDTGCVTDEMIRGMQGADTVIIEANHDVEMLRSGRYPYSLKRRILSRNGHLSNIDCGKFAVLLANSGTKHIILGHLSRENNTPEAAESAVKAALERFELKVSVAPAADILESVIGEPV